MRRVVCRRAVEVVDVAVASQSHVRRARPAREMESRVVGDTHSVATCSSPGLAAMFALELARGKAGGMEAYSSQAKRRGVREERQMTLGLLGLLNLNRRTGQARELEDDGKKMRDQNSDGITSHPGFACVTTTDQAQPGQPGQLGAAGRAPPGAIAGLALGLPRTQWRIRHQISVSQNGTIPPRRPFEPAL
jgi:hypothetical protein